MPDVIYQLLLDWGSFFRLYVRNIALAKVATSRAIFVMPGGLAQRKRQL